MGQNIKIVPLDPKNKMHSQTLTRWWNDPQIKHLYIKFQNAKAARAVMPEQRLVKIWENAQRNNSEFVALLEGSLVSHLSIRLSQRRRRSKPVLIASLSIVIGNPALRSQGLGRRLMKYMERKARSQEAHIAQVKVFEFNESAIRFYEVLGYRRVRRKRACTWWQRRMWDVVLFEKVI